MSNVYEQQGLKHSTLSLSAAVWVGEKGEVS